MTIGKVLAERVSPHHDSLMLSAPDSWWVLTSRL